jgi:folate-binding protein YgfZ
MAKQSLLHGLHQSNGAVFAERDGWLLPLHYGDPAAEYRAVRQDAGLIDLGHRGLLQFTGPDRVAFLQGLLSNDVRALEPFEGQYAALLTQQGKIVADVRVLCSMRSFYLDCWEHLKATILAHLNRYLIADEVEIADRSPEYAMISLQGPKARALLQDVVGPADARLPQQAKQHSMIDLAGSATCVVYDSHTGEAGYDLIAPVGSLASIAAKLSDSGRGYGVCWVGEDALNVLRVEAGIPRYGVDFGADHLLLEVGIENAVSFTKGCYLGQEIVERIRSRGHVNKKLCGLAIEGGEPVPAGETIRVDAREVGTITSSVLSPRWQQAIALGYVHKDFWTANTEVEIGPSQRRARVTPLPFLPSS